MSRPRLGVHGVILGLLTAGVAVVVVWTVWTGWDFYLTAYGERPHHPGYHDYRPAGFIGHGLGIVGSLMILLLLLYSLRKRVRFMRRWGDLRIWLRYHIFLGIAGPILITLHTSFKINGLVSVSYWSMAAVALSGFFGRYLYQQIPRNMLGETMSVDEIEAANEELLVELSTAHGADQKALGRLEEIAVAWLQKRAAPVALLSLPVLNAVLARQLQSWSVDYIGNRRPQAENRARKWALQTRRLLLFHQVRDLFHYWHVFHKPFAFIMILVMIVHVGVTVALGHTWIFGS